MNDKISVIMPIYNTVKYLQEAIESVLNQTYKNWECFLVDDGSTDGCGAICDSYGEKDERFQVIHSDNLGVSHARNIALERVTGEWVCFIDSDDCFERDAFEKFLFYADDADVVMGSHRRTHDIDSGAHSLKQYDVCKIKDIQLDELFHMFFFYTVWGKLYRRRAVVSFFPESMTLGEDTTFNLESFWNWKKIVIMPECVLNCHVRNDSLSEKFYFDFPDKLWKIFEKWTVTFENRKGMLENASKWYVSSLRWYYELFIRNVQMSEKDKLTLMNIWLKEEPLNDKLVQSGRLNEVENSFWHMVCEKDNVGIFNSLKWKSKREHYE